MTNRTKMRNKTVFPGLSLAASTLGLALAALPSYAAPPPPPPEVTLLRMAVGADSVTVSATLAITYTGACTSVTCPTIADSATPGVINWEGTIDGYFLMVTGETKPDLVSPSIDIGPFVSGPAGTVTISFTDTNFTLGSGPSTMVLYAPEMGSVTYTSYSDIFNTPFGMSTEVGSATLTPSSPGVSVTGPGPANEPFSMTSVITLSNTSSGFFSTDFNYYGIAVKALPSSLGSADAATIGFWHNNNGQGLIDGVNGGPASTALGTWLATTFPNLYGSLAGKTNAQVAAYYLTLFSGNKTAAQIMAGALACYVTDPSLAGTTAVGYGFKSFAGGTGSLTFNVGSDGTAIGLTNNTTYTIAQLLLQVNLDSPLTSAESNAFNVIFSDINQDGDIN